ncbi:MAG: UDP-N-acetyl glucosamine 2-epimerase, partial [Clostridia bacterium]|nr:UDP-N-acetyl glucosamine 2-epimerase [Clostridia bacterium]
LRGYSLFHIEAGLRTGEKSEPFPEEVFRRGIGTMADVHFATTTEARAHLLKEGIREENIILSGNTEADALRDLLPHAPKRQPTVLITLHRRENLSALDGILQAVRELAERFPERRFFFPVHPSPAFAEAVREHLYGVPNLTQSPPIPPTEFLGYLKSAEAVLTDSGGVSEECAILGVPTVVMRNKTEREAELRSGCVFLAGTQKDGILSVTAPILRNPAAVALPPSFPKRSPSAVIAREMLRHIKNGDP